MGYCDVKQPANQCVQDGRNNQSAKATQFVDKRANSAVQLQIQNMMNTSPRLAAQRNIQASISASPATQQQAVQRQVDSVKNGVIQAKTEITHRTSTMKYDTFAPEKVGVSMAASLDPLDPVRGSATDSPNTPMYSALWKSHRMVRGHLLNHDLGGFGLAENLFPITSGANSDHSITVEADVKNTLAQAAGLQKPFKKEDKGIRVKYNVDVERPSEIANNAFLCSWQLIDPVNGNGSVSRVKIPSLATEVRAWHGGGTGSKTAGWAHGARKGDRAGDRSDYDQITETPALNDMGAAHTSTVAKLAAMDQSASANPHAFVKLMYDYNQFMDVKIDMRPWMDWFHIMVETDGGLEEIDNQMDTWEEEMDDATAQI